MQTTLGSVVKRSKAYKTEEHALTAKWLKDNLLKIEPPTVETRNETLV